MVWAGENSTCTSTNQRLSVLLSKLQSETNSRSNYLYTDWVLVKNSEDRLEKEKQLKAQLISDLKKQLASSTNDLTYDEVISINNGITIESREECIHSPDVQKVGERTTKSEFQYKSQRSSLAPNGKSELTSKANGFESKESRTAIYANLCSSKQQYIQARLHTTTVSRVTQKAEVLLYAIQKLLEQRQLDFAKKTQKFLSNLETMDLHIPLRNSDLLAFGIDRVEDIEPTFLRHFAGLRSDLESLENSLTLLDQLLEKSGPNRFSNECLLDLNQFTSKAREIQNQSSLQFSLVETRIASWKKDDDGNLYFAYTPNLNSSTKSYRLFNIQTLSPYWRSNATQRPFSGTINSPLTKYNLIQNAIRSSQQQQLDEKNSANKIAKLTKDLQDCYLRLQFLSQLSYYRIFLLLYPSSNYQELAKNQFSLKGDSGGPLVQHKGKTFLIKKLDFPGKRVVTNASSDFQPVIAEGESIDYLSQFQLSSCSYSPIYTDPDDINIYNTFSMYRQGCLPEAEGHIEFKPTVLNFESSAKDYASMEVRSSFNKWLCPKPFKQSSAEILNSIQ